MIEAKVGFDIPTAQQLEPYVEHVHDDRRAGALATLTNAPALAKRDLGTSIDGVPVRHISWEEFYATCRLAATHVRGTERFLLTELVGYLKEIMSARDLLSQSGVRRLSRHGPSGGA